MTDITDQDRRTAIDVAEAIERGDYPMASMWPILARVILATVEAPEPTLAEGLRCLTRRLERTTDPDRLLDLAADFFSVADYAEQMEHDLTDTRAEVERLTAVNEEIRRTDNYREFKAFLGVQKGAESNAETPDPADVKEEEPYHIYYGVYGNDHTIGVRIDGKWRCIGDDRGVHVTDTNIASLTRLVPAPRVITDPNELAKIRGFAIGMTTRTEEAWQRDMDGWCSLNRTGKFTSKYIIERFGPMTILHEQEKA